MAPLQTSIEPKRSARLCVPLVDWRVASRYDAVLRPATVGRSSLGDRVLRLVSGVPKSARVMAAVRGCRLLIVSSRNATRLAPAGGAG